MSFFVETQNFASLRERQFFEIELLDVLEYLDNLDWVTQKRNNNGKSTRSC